jgi:hypothetical protein
MVDWVRMRGNPVCQSCKRTESVVEQTKCANCGIIRHTKKAYGTWKTYEIINVGDRNGQNI